MTTKLKPVTKLVETLNELFGRFDDASEVNRSSLLNRQENKYFLVNSGTQSPQDKIPGRLLLLCGRFTTRSGSKSCGSLRRFGIKNDRNNPRSQVSSTLFTQDKLKLN